MSVLAKAMEVRVQELEAEVTALRRPVEQSAEIEAIRAEWGDSFVMPEVAKLLSALDRAQREIQDLRSAHVPNREYVDGLLQQIASLSSPPEERKDIAERQTAYREQLIASDCLSSVSAEAAVRDIDTLLQDLARARKAYDDRVRMLGIVQDALSERNRQNVELRAKCERLEADNKRLCDVDSENAGLEYGLDEADIECAELRQLIERLEGANRALTEACARMRPLIRPNCCAGENDERAIDSLIALAASQHTAGSGDGVAGD